jgi:hypothetical protein
MRALLFGKKPLLKIRSFYCRLNNRSVGACPRSEGPRGCPLRRECQAHVAGASESRALRIAPHA